MSNRSGRFRALVDSHAGWFACGFLLLAVGSVALPIVGGVGSLRRPAPPLEQVGHGGGRAAFERDMTADMAKMMSTMRRIGYSGNPDIDFFVMTLPLSQGAVDMARLALTHGTDALTRGVAEEIIASQTVAIAAMTARLHALRAGRNTDADACPALGGLRCVVATKHRADVSAAPPSTGR